VLIFTTRIEQHEKEHCLQDQRPEAMRPAFEFRFVRPSGDALDDVAERRITTGREDHRRARAAHYRGAEEHELRRVGSDSRQRPLGSGFFGGQRLAGDGCLAHVQVVDLHEAGVCGHEIPQPKRMTSPTTMSRRGSSTHTPSRRTVAVGATLSCRRETARCD
jgi:hypothetical protein